MAKDKLIIVPFVASAVLILISIFISSTNFYGINGKLIVNYGVNGEPILGNLATIGSIIAISIIITLINSFLIYVIYSRERFFARLLSFTNLLIAILTLGALVAIGSFN